MSLADLKSALKEEEDSQLATKTLISESVDSLCTDGTDAQCMQYLIKSPITSPQIIYAKYLFKHSASHTLSIGTSGSMHIPDLCCDNGK